MSTLLVVTELNDPEVDRVLRLLTETGTPYIRTDISDLGDTLHWNAAICPNADLDIGKLNARTRSLQEHEVGAVWYRKPVAFAAPEHLHPELQLYAKKENEATFGNWLLSLPVPWMNHPYQIARAENRIQQLRLARSLGLRIPDTCITNQPDTAREFIKKHGGDVIIKVLSSQEVIGDGEILFPYTRPIEHDELEDLEKIRISGTCLQERIEFNKEVRTTVVGDTVIGTEIRPRKTGDRRADWRLFASEGVDYYPVELPRYIQDICLKIVRHFDLEFGAIDLLCVDSEYVFLEINPQGLWGWLEEETGQEIAAAHLKHLQGLLR